MSVSSILAFVLAGVAAKVKSGQIGSNRVKSVQVARRSDDDAAHAVMKDMARELRAAEARIAELEGDVHRANVQFRRDQDLIDIWRTRALYAEAPPGAIRPLGPDFRPPQIAQQQSLIEQQSRAALQRQAANMQQMAQAQAALQQSQLNAQYNAQHAQQAFPGLASMGLLGAQSLINAELFCNCVPSRSQVWATSDPE
jgi:hypothetical protein